ncbi:SWIM zinc finger family protein [Paenibacillus sp. CAU 1782]
MHVNKGLFSNFEKDMREHLSLPDLKRGWTVYIEGNVDQVKEVVHNTITGIVRGDDLCAVVMDFDNFRYISCTCPYDGYCMHMAAVFFQCLAQNEGEQEAKQSYFRMMGISAASALVAAGDGSNRGNDETFKMEQTIQHPEKGGEAPAHSLLSWFNEMDEMYGDTWQKCRHSLHALQPVLSGLKGVSKNWDKPMLRLHWIASIVFVMEQAERAINTVDSFSRYYHEMSFLRMAEPWIEHAYGLIAEIDAPGLEGEELSILNDLTAYVRRRAFLDEKQLFEWLQLYMAICENLSVNEAWFRHELSYLTDRLDGIEEDEQGSGDRLHAAAGMMHYFAQDDRKAIQHFRQCSFERNQRLIYPCVGARINEENWELAEEWMVYLFDSLKGVRSARNIGPFMTLCRYGDAARPDLPQWNQYMMELLPYSYSDLSEHWIEMKRFRDWADLQMLMGVKPEDHNAATLRDVGKADPQCLIPLYHQSIEAAIQSRNRQSYRMAVKHLKKLEKLYKAVKEGSRFETYLSRLVAKYQRLRALQEELWRGKLIQ